MIQSGQPVWSRREEPNLSESSLAGGPEGSRSEPERSLGERSESGDQPIQPNWIQTNLATGRRTKPVA
ncbi:MAG: hypothetical protein GY696_11535 [Gammaproteobacteria bacterium]|nr:hypothetical protein [Gammaproteobacteria bacterium]